MTCSMWVLSVHVIHWGCGAVRVCVPHVALWKISSAWPALNSFPGFYREMEQKTSGGRWEAEQTVKVGSTRWWVREVSRERQMTRLSQEPYGKVGFKATVGFKSEVVIRWRWKTAKIISVRTHMDADTFGFPCSENHLELLNKKLFWYSEKVTITVILARNTEYTQYCNVVIWVKLVLDDFFLATLGQQEHAVNITTIL